MIALLRIPALFSLLLMLLCGSPAHAEDDEASPFNPLRLSYIEGDVSFWRYGAEDWTEARRNTPLAAGDALYVDGEGNLELQMGSRAFIRAGDDTQLSLVNQTADYAQFKVANGRVSFDLRTLPAGYTVEVNTPNAVFTIERSGYYRVDVGEDVHFITRRGGRATLVPAGGHAMSVLPSEEVVVRGTTVAQAETYVAPELDGWDRWNYDRTETLLDVASERYLAPDVAGAYDLDYYGRWRVVPEYGTVWVPLSVAPGWAPYSTGRWVWDPYYQWTWIDDAPWGWAPYHYGRWVYLDGYWAWAPGPVVRRAVYAPALVAFYGSGTHVSISFGTPLCWVALSWGEPLVPWWGRHRYVGRPWWGGWYGPRVVNNVVVKNTTVVNVTNITYVNTRVSNAIVAAPRERFGKGYVETTRIRPEEHRKLSLVRGALPVKPEAVSLVPGERKGARPPEAVLSRPAVATRAPREVKLPWRSETARPEDKAAPAQRFVVVPKPRTESPARPAFGMQTGEERPRPPEQPRFEDRRREEARGGAAREAEPVNRFGAAPPGSMRFDTRQLEREPPRLALPQPAAPRSMREEAARPVPEVQRERVAPPVGGRESVPPEIRREPVAPPPQSERSRAAPPEERMRAVPQPPPGTLRAEPREDRPAITPRGLEGGGQRGLMQREEVDNLPGRSANRIYGGPDRARGEIRGDGRGDARGGGRGDARGEQRGDQRGPSPSGPGR